MLDGHCKLKNTDNINDMNNAWGNMENSTPDVNAHSIRKQGNLARALDRMPDFMQTSLVKVLKYPFDYPKLDSFTRLLMAVQYQQGTAGLIGEDLIQSRQLLELQATLLRRKPTPISQVKDLKLPLHSGEIKARHYHPAPKKKLPMLVFYHGGGFVMGSCVTHDEACRLIALHANVQILSIDYPLAPEVSPQTLIQSCEDALAWVYQNRGQFKVLKNRIAVAGDSAGANIATVLAQRARHLAYRPQTQFLIYPVVDFKSRHPSFYHYKEGLLLTSQDVELVTDYYAYQHSIALDDPIISPTYGDLNELSPTYLVTAGHDVLHDEAEIYAYKLKQHGVKVEYREYEDQTHGFINMSTVSKTSKKYLIEMSKDFRRFWDKSI